MSDSPEIPLHPFADFLWLSPPSVDWYLFLSALLMYGRCTLYFYEPPNRPKDSGSVLGKTQGLPDDDDDDSQMWIMWGL